MLKLLLSSTFLWILLSSSLGAQTTLFYSQGRNFRLVSPVPSEVKKPLLVLLHGCKQDSKIFLEGTNLEAEALKKNFFVLVPEQSVNSNSDHCWNWFYAHEQERGSYEMESIIATLESLIQSKHIDREKIFVAGLSAGGALAHSLMNCYPDYFSGVAIQSGLAYKVAESIYEAQTVLTGSNQKPVNYLGQKAASCSRIPQRFHRLKKSIIIHGEDDPRVNPLHAELISASNEVRFDVLDDGLINHSLYISVSEQFENYPHGYSAIIKDKSFNHFSERLILIKGMKHAWGGGKPLSVNFDPDAPSTTNSILNYFNL
jgi:poly(hydroxyalkanoate) depolymerase family esterase